MRDRTYIDTNERRFFESQIKEVKPHILNKVLDGKNDAGWWRSMRIRRAWQKLVGKFDPEYQGAIRQQYCPPQ